jgi:transcription elongation factor Elf1
MAAMLVARTVACPYCGERFETTLDLSAGDQEYIEDCQVCCQPIVFRVTTGPDGRLRGVDTRRDHD